MANILKKTLIEEDGPGEEKGVIFEVLPNQKMLVLLVFMFLRPDLENWNDVLDKY